MSSKVPTYDEACVWVWLPGATDPVVAGRLDAHDGLVTFNYGKSYLERDTAFPLYEPELPLQPGALPLLPGLSMPNCLRDAAPDAWGRRVVINRLLGLKGVKADSAQLDDLTYLLESGSDRIGALDFWRLRLGIGHPGDRSLVADYVLAKPAPDDREAIERAIDKSLDVLPLCLAGDLQGAMLKLHTKEKT